MKAISYNKYINKIGIEFEGYYRSPELVALLDSCPNELLREHHSDGSLNSSFSENSTTVYYPQEFVTNPLDAKHLAEVLKLWRSLERRNLWKVDSAVGLHFHISLTHNYYYFLETPLFFQRWKELFCQIDPKAYTSRLAHSRYCSPDHDDPHHYQLESPDRYHMVNYCYLKHQTVEFRGYGGPYATISKLSELIQGTIDLIDNFIPRQEAKAAAMRQEIAGLGASKTESSESFQAVNAAIEIEQNLKRIRHRTQSFKIRPLLKEPEVMKWKNVWEFRVFRELAATRSNPMDEINFSANREPSILLEF